jgi:hypothetical protein
MNPVTYAVASPLNQVTQRSISLDLLKLLLAFMVVGLHVGFLTNISPTAGYLTGNGLFRMAVPVFLITNGFFLHTVFQKGRAAAWFKRLVLLYVFWTIVYSSFWLFQLPATPAAVAKATHTIIVGYFHLWYLPGLIGAAFLLLWLRHQPVTTLLAVACLLYACGVAIQYAGNYHLAAGTGLDRVFNTTWLHRSFLFLSFPFVALGYAIRELRLHERFNRSQLLIASVAGVLLLLLESYFNYMQPHNEGGFDNFLSLPLVCTAVFLFVVKVPVYGDDFGLSHYSSGIYFIHILVLTVLHRLFPLDMTSMTIAVFAVSVLLVRLLVPLDRKLGFIL